MKMCVFSGYIISTMMYDLYDLCIQISKTNRPAEWQFEWHISFVYMIINLLSYHSGRASLQLINRK